MPELPEVEVTKRDLVQHIVGDRIVSVRLGKPLRWPLYGEPDRLIGQKVSGVRRRGKYLLLDLDQGLLLVHLGMSGSLRYDHQLPLAGAHDHFDLVLERGTVRLHDPRRFGAVVFVHGEEDPVALKLLGNLGLEPLSDEFTAEAFHSKLKASKMAIKQLLLAGKVVVGVGNIYASEALFAAGIHPTTAARQIDSLHAEKLHQSIRSILLHAVSMGGTTLRDFSRADGMSGHFQNETKVYGRAGEACQVCATPIILLKQGQRSTFYCPQCQQ